MLRPVNKVGQYDTVPFSSPHYSNYYVQEEVDDGVVMESTLAVKDVCVYFSFFYVIFYSFFTVENVWPTLSCTLHTLAAAAVVVSASASVSSSSHCRA